MVPLPRFASFEAFNEYLEQHCRERQPTRDHQLLLHQLKLQLPVQPLPRISA